MDKQFWINAWNEGRTGFHQENYHHKLLQYFPSFNLMRGQKVLVPMCGKSKDMIWLHDQGLQVHGIELYENPVKDFFVQNNLVPFNKVQFKEFIRYSFGGITIDAGDFFQFESHDYYDFIYDRASLVALPQEMRRQYAQVINRSTKSGGKCLLIVYEYDQSQMDGPPFAVSEQEIRHLYGDHFSISLLDSSAPEVGSRLSGVLGLKHKVYYLKKE